MTKKLNFYQESFDSNVIEEEFSFYLKEKLHLSDKDIFIHNDRLLTKVEENLIEDFFKQKKEGIPLDYILNSTKFYYSDFYVDSRVLIPRPETELLVDYVVKNFKDTMKVLDAGTGSGCIIISIIKQRPKCSGIAIDVSKSALKVAISNAKMHHLKNKINFFNINIDKFQLNKYDFIVSNPPYINNINLKRLETNVKLYEPKLLSKQV